MSIRFVHADELRAKVRFEHMIETVGTAFQESSAGKAQNGLIVMFSADRSELGDIAVKTGVLLGHDVFVVKVAPWFAANRDSGQHQGGFVAVFDSRTGHTLAILDDQHYLSDLRTAAAGALAARALAPAKVTTATVLGSGTQAYWQPQALYFERPFQRLLIWTRNPAKAERLRSQLREVLPAVELEITSDLEGAVRTADVLMTTTAAREPLVRGEWLHPAQHITAVGADDTTKCELDALTLSRARVFVDSMEANIANGDLHRALQGGLYRLEQVAGEIGDVLATRKIGRSSPSDITIAKFVGIGTQDLAAAKLSLRVLGER
jgi:ornithine cyclodeaminase/alanine dehydrogenase-like protein (mu-crystallin family)